MNNKFYQRHFLDIWLSKSVYNLIICSEKDEIINNFNSKSTTNIIRF